MARQRHKIDPMAGKATQFKKGQTAPIESKRDGWAKKKKGRELAELILGLIPSGKIIDEKGNERLSVLRKATAAYFGVPEKEITVEQMILFGQAKIAIFKEDTNAAKFLHEIAYCVPAGFP